MCFLTCTINEMLKNKKTILIKKQGHMLANFLKY